MLYGLSNLSLSFPLEEGLHTAHVGLDLTVPARITVNSSSSYLHFPSDGITGVYQSTQLRLEFYPSTYPSRREGQTDQKHMNKQMLMASSITKQNMIKL